MDKPRPIVQAVLAHEPGTINLPWAKLIISATLQIDTKLRALRPYVLPNSMLATTTKITSHSVSSKYRRLRLDRITRPTRRFL